MTQLVTHPQSYHYSKLWVFF